MADRILTKAARKTSHVKGYYSIKRKTPLLAGYILAATAALIPLAGAITILCKYDFSRRTDYPLASAAATLLGVFAAALGWGVASWTAHRNARAQHTINFLATRFSNSSFSEQAAIFNKSFAGKVINSELISRMVSSQDIKDTDAVQAMRYLLNWFEFIAVGVVQGDLDLQIVTKTIRSNLKFYTDKCLIYISEVRKSQPLVLENLVDLRLHFEEH